MCGLRRFQGRQMRPNIIAIVGVGAFSHILFGRQSTVYSSRGREPRPITVTSNGSFPKLQNPSSASSPSEEAGVVSSANDASFRSFGLGCSLSFSPFMRATRSPAETTPNSLPAYPQPPILSRLRHYQVFGQQPSSHGPDRSILKFRAIQEYVRP